MVIESSSNAVFKNLLALTTSKGIKDQGKALVGGEKITAELASRKEFLGQWILSTKMEQQERSDVKPVVLSSELFKQLDVGGTNKPLWCCEFAPIKDLKDLDDDLPALYVGLSDPSNLGALVRTCAAFEWKQVVLLLESAHPFLPKAIRGSSGSCFKTTFFRGPSIHDLNGKNIIALDKGGKTLSPSDIKKNAKILVGEEGKGVPALFAGQRLQIPISDEVESLNATIAGSLLIYEWSKL